MRTTDPPRTDGPARPGSVLAVPNYRRLWTAFLFSVTGYAIGNTTLLWLVFDRTHSPVAVSLLGIAGFLPAIVFGVFAGALADRYERRRLMILADVVRAACVVSIPLTYLAIGFSLPLVLGVVFILEGFSSLFRPASNSLLPQLVPGERLEQANGLLQAAQSTGQSAGNVLAGVLIALVGALVGLYVNSATFVVSALLISLLVVPSAAGAQDSALGGRRSLRADVAEGVAFLRGQRGLLYGTFAGTAINFFATLAGQFLVVYVSEGLHGGAFAFGGVLAAFTTGIMAGALLAGRFRLGNHLGRALTALCLPAGAGIATLALLPADYVVAVLLFGVGACLGLLNTTFFAAVQRMVPNAVLGRYLSLDEVGSLSAVPVAQVSGAFLILRLGLPTTYLIAGFGMVGVAVAMALVRPLRELTDEPIHWPVAPRSEPQALPPAPSR